MKIKLSPDTRFLPEIGNEPKSHYHAKSVYFAMLSRSKEMFKPLSWVKLDPSWLRNGLWCQRWAKVIVLAAVASWEGDAPPVAPPAPFPVQNRTVHGDNVQFRSLGTLSTMLFFVFVFFSSFLLLMQSCFALCIYIYKKPKQIRTVQTAFPLLWSGCSFSRAVLIKSEW